MLTNWSPSTGDDDHDDDDDDLILIDRMLVRNPEGGKIGRARRLHHVKEQLTEQLHKLGEPFDTVAHDQ